MLHHLFYKLRWYNQDILWQEYPGKLFRIATLGGGEQLLGALWFLIVLLELSILFRMLLWLVERFPRAIQPLCLTLLVLLCCIIGASTQLPRSFSRTLFFMPYYAAGFAFYKPFKNILTKTVRVTKVILFISSLFPLLVAVHLKRSYEETSFLPFSLLCAFSGIIFCFVLGDALQRPNLFSSFLRWCGRYSFWIMTFHFVGFKLFASLLYALTILQQQDLAAFPVPEHLPYLFRLGFLASGILVSLFLGYLFRHLALCWSPLTSLIRR